MEDQSRSSIIPEDSTEWARTVLEFMRLSERIKCELRHSWLSSGRRESVAEHSWQMAILVLLTHHKLSSPVDLLRSLQMVLIHDLVEAEAGDVPFTEVSLRRVLKADRERQAIENIRSRLGDGVGQHLFDLWMEFEMRESNEAKFATALDNLEVQVQHNLADLSTWEDIEFDLVYTKMDRHCAHDPFLTALCDVIKEDAEAKWLAAGISVDQVRARAAGASNDPIVRPSSGRVVAMDATPDAVSVARSRKRRSKGRTKGLRPTSGQGSLFGDSR